jgi:hypothetical protein
MPRLFFAVLFTSTCYAQLIFAVLFTSTCYPRLFFAVLITSTCYAQLYFRSHGRANPLILTTLIMPAEGLLCQDPAFEFLLTSLPSPFLCQDTAVEFLLTSLQSHSFAHSFARHNHHRAAKYMPVIQRFLCDVLHTCIYFSPILSLLSWFLWFPACSRSAVAAKPTAQFARKPP